MEVFEMNNEIYLQHHGVKGQKWGVRRYQNKDGSLTQAGKARQKSSSASSSKSSSDTPSYKKMSNAQLQKKIDRLNLEANYRAAVAKDAAANTSKGKAYVSKLTDTVINKSIEGLGEAVKKTVSDSVSKAATDAIRNATSSKK